MGTIAKGIETPEQMARITAEGCTQAQGYLISHPLPPDAVRAFIAARRTAVILPENPAPPEETRL